MAIADRLRDLDIEIGEPFVPPANFVNAVRSGNLVFISGHGPRRPDGSHVIGRLGAGLSVEQGYEAARLCAIQCLAALKAEIGDLDRVVRIVKLLGMVNCTDDFGQQPEVMNGASDLLQKLLGESGRHARPPLA